MQGRAPPLADVLGGGQFGAQPKGNAIIIAKQASGSAEIDPLMAAFNAIALRTPGRRGQALS